MPSVTPRQTRFAQEYTMDRNATRSAVAAGLSRRTARSQGARLLKNVNVRAAVAAEEAEVATRIKLRHDDILRDLIALRSAAAEAGQFAAAIRATEMLGRHIGMWPTRVEIARPDGAPGQQATPDSVHTVVADVISILTDHKLNLPLDPAAVARLTADDSEVARPTNPQTPITDRTREATPTRADNADVPIAASYVLARSAL